MAQSKSASRAKTKTASAAKGKGSSAALPKRAPIRREVAGLICLVLGLFTLIGYFQQDFWLLDAICLYVFKGLFGWGFLVVPPCFFLAAWILLFHRGRPVALRLTAVALIPFFFGAAVHLGVCQEEFGFTVPFIRSLYLGGKEMETGGVLSGLTADALRKAVSVYGAMPLVIILLFTCIFISLRISPRRIYSELRFKERPKYEPIPEPVPAPTRSRPVSEKKRVPPANPLQTEIYEALPVSAGGKADARPSGDRKRRRPIDIDPPEEPAEEQIPDMPPGPIYGLRPVEPITSGPRRIRRKPEPKVEEYDPEGEIVGPVTSNVSGPVELQEGSASIASAGGKHQKPAPAEPQTTAEEISREIESAGNTSEYRFPPVELLKLGTGISSDGRDEVALNKERLETSLRSFGIAAPVCDITRGPTVTRFDLELEPGVKLSRLTNLAGDIALQLGVTNVRIAPIPDKVSTVGVEVPNKIVSTVYLRDIIDSPAFRTAKSKLSFAVGKDIGGNCIVGNISKMPHMLIAGTTGSGKSVCMNSLIISLLYKSTPDEVRLIMIDPKMVELGIYNGIPHLYIPVVTDPKKAAGALQWAVVEMMKRYRLFSEVGVRDLTGYNKYLQNNSMPIVPNVVIVIDELADLMMTAAKEVEESICRVAQMGRAAGMHLVIATQRPSADVITGLMKANIPSRIAFAVSSAMESRIIMDNPGAEKLIGMGDMLYAPLGCGKPLRVQGAFVSDEERERVIDFIKQSSEAQYDEDILTDIESRAAGKDAAENPSGSSDTQTADGADDNPFAGYDELLPQAVEVILEIKMASTSMLQRRLKLGYSRAARLIDQMEELGFVGPYEGSKPRAVLITRERWDEMKMSGYKPGEQLAIEQMDDFSAGGSL